MQTPRPNLDATTVASFGAEWSTFTQDGVSASELKEIFGSYFSLFPWARLDRTTSVGADFGCGSGRWARLVAPKVKTLHLIDASAEALKVARANLSGSPNAVFHHASIEAAPIAENSLDFAFSLGVLHHLPDTERALRDIHSRLKPGAPFLIYLYYALDGRPLWFRLLWKMSDVARRSLCRLPRRLRRTVTDLIAAFVYWPLAQTAAVLEKKKALPPSFPLSFYRHRSFYIMRNDALDRFGTPLERRFTRKQIRELLVRSGFNEPQFSDEAPYWCALAYKSSNGQGVSG